MKTTIMTFALALAAMPLTFAAQSPAPGTPAAPAASKPAVVETAKTTKKHHTAKTVKAAKTPKTAKTPAASTTPAPVKP